MSYFCVIDHVGTAFQTKNDQYCQFLTKNLFVFMLFFVTGFITNVRLRLGLGCEPRLYCVTIFLLSLPKQKSNRMCHVNRTTIIY